MAADPTPARSQSRFRVMGSDAHLIVEGSPTLLATARARLEDLEARWSRFVPTSEISRLNAAGGDLTVVSPETARLVTAAVEGWNTTDGRFDPTVLGDVVRAGYDRSAELLPPSRSLAPASSLSSGAAGIVVLPRVPAVCLPPGVGFDPGGIGKGLAADIVAEELMAAGADGACVNVGGDLRVVGTCGGDHRWVIDIDPVDDGRTVATVALAAGAVATSTRRRRAWSVAGEPRHHLIDPATGQPAAGGIAAVTVLADRCWRAEVLTKAAFVAGADGALDVIEASGASGLIVSDDGAVRLTAGLAPFVLDPDLAGAHR